MLFYVSIGIKKEKCISKSNDSPPNVHIRLDMSSLNNMKMHG